MFSTPKSGVVFLGEDLKSVPWPGGSWGTPAPSCPLCCPWRSDYFRRKQAVTINDFGVSQA